MLRQYLDEVRCPQGMPEIGSDVERDALLIGLRRTVSDHPMQAGIQTRVIRKRIKRLGQIATAPLRADAEKTADLQ